MVHCTQAAASALHDVRQQQGVPDTFGLRLFGSEVPGGQVAVRMGFVEEPLAGDEVAEEHGQRMFVDPALAPHLTDMAIDATPDPDGGTAAASGLFLRPSAPD